MRSGELARLAGVTVRALRHYHQVGVLAEPERRHNGYREYDVHDLIRVVRIKRLASLGIALERMPDLLDDAAHDRAALLEDLDAELGEQIRRLTAQRDLVARLRAQNTSPDLPPELAPFLETVAAAGLSPGLSRIDRDQSILLAHLAGEEGLPQLARFYERISAPEVAPAIATIAARFDDLGPETSDAELDEFIESFVATFTPILVEFSSDLDADAVGAIGAQHLLTEYTDDVLNDRQQLVLARLESAFGD